MKRLLAVILLLSFVLASCATKPQYKTRKGKKKLNHYNSIQYNKP